MWRAMIRGEQVHSREVSGLALRAPVQLAIVSVRVATHSNAGIWVELAGRELQPRKRDSSLLERAADAVKRWPCFFLLPLQPCNVTALYTKGFRHDTLALA